LNARTPRLKNVVAAFAAAPLGGAAMLTVIALAFSETHTSIDGTPVAAAVSAYVHVRMALVFFLMGAIVCYPVAIILGIPGYLLFRHRGWIRRRHWILLFAIVGGGVAVVGLPLFGFIAVFGLLAGIAMGFVFALTIRVEAPSADEVASTFE
jgi:hypothetical protein